MKLGSKILAMVISSYSRALANIPLERASHPDGRVRNPVCEHVNARWMGVSRFVPQFIDGLEIDLPFEPIEYLRGNQLLPGDVLVCCPKENISGASLVVDKLGNSIRVFTRGIFTHVAIVGRDNQIYEANLPENEVSSFDEWIKNFDYAVVLRHGLAEEAENREAICKFLDNQPGIRYNIARSIGVMLVGHVAERNYVSNLLELVIKLIERCFYRQSHICSTFVWSALSAGKIAPGQSSFSRYITPSDFIDQSLLDPVGYVTNKPQIHPKNLDVLHKHYKKRPIFALT